MHYSRRYAVVHRTLPLTICCLILLLGIAAVCALPWNGLSFLDRWRERRSGHLFYASHTKERVVALTFDDGPDPRYTPHVLDVLQREHIKATFFVCGNMLDRNPELAKRIVANGHVLGNHTQSHPHLELAKNPDIRNEIDQCESRIGAVTGERTYLFRPPRGLWNHTVFRDAMQRRYNIVLWSLAFDRQAIHDSARLRNRVLSLAKPGDIILMHDGSSSKRDERAPTVKELANVIRGLKARGFRFATVPELLHITGDRPVPVARISRASAGLRHSLP